MVIRFQEIQQNIPSGGTIANNGTQTGGGGTGGLLIGSLQLKDQQILQQHLVKDIPVTAQGYPITVYMVEHLQVLEIL